MFIHRKRGFLKNKRGALVAPLFWLIDLILIILVLYFSTNFIDEVAEKTTFEMNFLARDLSLLVDSIYASPGNFMIDYPDTTFWFSFAFKDLSVKVFEGEEVIKKIRTQYPFMENQGLKLERIITPARTLKPEERTKGDAFFVGNFYAQKPELSPETSVRLRLVRYGDIIDVEKQNESVMDLRALRCSEIGAKSAFPRDVASVWTQKEDIKSEVERVRSGLHRIIILIRYGDNPDTSINNIKAYVPVNQVKFAQSKYLGCMVLNELLSNKAVMSLIKNDNLADFTGLSVVPVDIGLSQEEKYIIILEIGNTGIEEARNILSHKDVLNDAVGKSIENVLVG